MHKKIDIRRIGEEIRIERRRIDMTQKSLAEKAKVNVVAIYRLEKGTDFFEINKLYRIVSAVGMDFFSLINDKE